MLLIVQKWIKGGMCHSTYQYAKADNNIWKIMIKI